MRQFAEAETRRSGNSKCQPLNSKEFPNSNQQIPRKSKYQIPIGVRIGLRSGLEFCLLGSHWRLSLVIWNFLGISWLEFGVWNSVFAFSAAIGN
jgi:hypothetical protein